MNERKLEEVQKRIILKDIRKKESMNEFKKIGMEIRLKKSMPKKISEWKLVKQEKNKDVKKESEEN